MSTLYQRNLADRVFALLTLSLLEREALSMTTETSNVLTHLMTKGLKMFQINQTFLGYQQLGEILKKGTRDFNLKEYEVI